MVVRMVVIAAEEEAEADHGEVKADYMVVGMTTMPEDRAERRRH